MCSAPRVHGRGGPRRGGAHRVAVRGGGHGVRAGGARAAAAARRAAARRRRAARLARARAPLQPRLRRRAATSRHSRQQYDTLTITILLIQFTTYSKC